MASKSNDSTQSIFEEYKNHLLDLKEILKGAYVCSGSNPSLAKFCNKAYDWVTAQIHQLSAEIDPEVMDSLRKAMVNAYRLPAADDTPAVFAMYSEFERYCTKQ